MGKEKAVHERRARAKGGEHPLEKVLLVGNPNVGKSVLFGALTGRYVTVANYPGTTVEVTRGNAQWLGKRFQVLDTPGVNNLIPHSEDEQVTRDILMEERDQRVVQVADAKNLRRSLLITLELMEMGVPLVLALNMEDEASELGLEIDHRRLSEILGIPVVKTVATRRKGVDHLVQALEELGPAKGNHPFPRELEEAVVAIETFLPESNVTRRSLAVMLMAEDLTLTRWLNARVCERDVRAIGEICRRIQSRYAEPLAYVINRHRLQAADEIVAKVVRQRGRRVAHWAQHLGNLSMHPVWGIPVLMGVLGLLYLFVGRFGAGTLVDLMQEDLFRGVVLPGLVARTEAWVPWAILRDFLVGPYGLFTMALTYALAIVLPIVGTFFIAFGILEDSGYMPRLAVMANRAFRVVGLSGKAVLPMLLGLGCDTMATLTTRILDTRKERVLVTLLLALGVPCSAQLGVILGMLGGLSAMAVAVWAGVILLTMLAVGYLGARLIPGEEGAFILELPPIRVPQLTNILVKTLARMEWYLKEAVPLFALGTLVLFALDKTGLLEIIQRGAAPLVVRWLGMPLQATEAFLIGFLRRDYGAAGLYALARDGVLDHTQILVSLVTITLFIPCIANLFIIMKERGWKTALWMVLVIFPLAFGVGGALNQACRWMGWVP
jgi:ferrous iron transport protein B